MDYITQQIAETFKGNNTVNPNKNISTASKIYQLEKKSLISFSCQKYNSFTYMLKVFCRTVKESFFLEKVIGIFNVAYLQLGVYSVLKIGKYALISKQIGISGCIEIGNIAKILSNFETASMIKDNQGINENLAFKLKNIYKKYVYFQNLPKIVA